MKIEINSSAEKFVITPELRAQHEEHLYVQRLRFEQDMRFLAFAAGKQSQPAGDGDEAPADIARDMNAKKILDEMGGSYEHPFRIGGTYFTRGAFHHTGRVKDIRGKWLVLEDAAWIANSGRFSDCIEGKADPAEVEPVTCPVYVNLAELCDAFEWRHALPRKQK